MNEDIINEALTNYLECQYAQLADKLRLSLDLTKTQAKIDAIKDELKRM